MSGPAGSRLPRWPLVVGAAPAVLFLVGAVAAAVHEGELVVIALAPLLAVWCFGLPILAGLRARRAAPLAGPAARLILIVVLGATALWIVLLVVGGRSTGFSGLLALPMVQGLAWVVGRRVAG